ncbi:Serine/threonine-protein kinase HipA [compost metagenome]
MNVKALQILVGDVRCGVLFQYAMPGAPTVNRFVADEKFIELGEEQPLLSASFLAEDPAEQTALWRDVRADVFNGEQSKDGKGSWLLPAFFQNLLPEGVFRKHMAEIRGCEPDDFFELLAACGKDLPGNVYALPVALERDELATLVTQDADALEMTVTAEPMPQGVSVSGVQPKIGVIFENGRYVARTKDRDRDTHIIAKLPVMSYPLLPEVEELSLRLARAAGVHTCEAYLEPLSKLAAQHNYELGDVYGTTNFLAVVRFDRTSEGRVHCEDFAQVLGVQPDDKYTTQVSYANVALALLGHPDMGEAAVHELLRRIMVNELLGNPDMHLKNIGVRYPAPGRVELSPAYDIVAHRLYQPIKGHGLRLLPLDVEKELRESGNNAFVQAATEKPRLTPAVLRVFCDFLGIPERPASRAVTECVHRAIETWPALIHESRLAETQKNGLLNNFLAHPHVQSAQHRAARKAKSLSPQEAAQMLAKWEQQAQHEGGTNAPPAPPPLPPAPPTRPTL